jgi:phosphoglycerate dehydrogenase-like enzyme
MFGVAGTLRSLRIFGFAIVAQMREIPQHTGSASQAWDTGGVTKIAVLDDYIGVALDYGDWSGLPSGASVTVYREAIPPARLVAELADYEIVVITQQRTRFPREVLAGLPKLRLIVCNGRTSNVIDHQARLERGIMLCGVVDTGKPAAGGYGAGSRGLPAPSEMAWALIFAVAKRLGIEDRTIRAGGWQTGFPVPLAGKTLGLLGAGRLGGAMVPVAKALGMDVIAWSTNLTDERCAELGVKKATKESLLAESDVLGVFLVFSERTRGLLGAAELAAMKPGSILVNVSRGPIVAEQALIDALNSVQLAGAGLDVFDQEPLPADHPFRSLDNVVVSPHVGYVTEQLFRANWQRMAEDVTAYLADAPIRVVTDPADCPPMAPQ